MCSFPDLYQPANQFNCFISFHFTLSISAKARTQSSAGRVSGEVGCQVEGSWTGAFIWTERLKVFVRGIYLTLTGGSPWMFSRMR